MENTVELLKKLTNPSGVGGDEQEIISTLVDILKNYGEVEVDCMNNVSCTFGKGYHFLIDAHLDEIGMIVTSISDDGFLRVSSCGGIDNRMLLGSEVIVCAKEKIRGVISTLPPHLQKGDSDKKVPDMDEISIDIGMSKENAEKLVSLGDTVIFNRHFTELLNNQVSANCLDDRAGIASIILALDELKKLPIKVTVLFSTQEEVGTRGAKIGAYNKNVDEAIAIDVSFGYTPNCSKEECGVLSKGPMIGFSPILDKNISSKLVEVAKNHSIPYQIEVMNGRTGTNADVITISQNGIKSSLISIPLKYMHSPVEVIDINDVENTSKLLCAYIKERIGEINA